VNGRGPPAVVLAGKLAFLSVQLLVGGIGPKVRTFWRLSLEGTVEFNEIIVLPSSGNYFSGRDPKNQFPPDSE